MAHHIRHVNRHFKYTGCCVHATVLARSAVWVHWRPLSHQEIPRERMTWLMDRGGTLLFLSPAKIRKAPDTFKFLRHVMRAILSARPKCSHRYVSRNETPSKCVEILTHATRRSTEQTTMRTKWFKHRDLNCSGTSLTKRGRCDENGENDEFAFCPLKTRVFAPPIPENDKNDENGGCHSG